MYSLYMGHIFWHVHSISIIRRQWNIDSRRSPRSPKLHTSRHSANYWGAWSCLKTFHRMQPKSCTSCTLSLRWSGLTGPRLLWKQTSTIEQSFPSGLWQNSRPLNGPKKELCLTFMSMKNAKSWFHGTNEFPNSSLIQTFPSKQYWSTQEVKWS